MRRKYEAMIVFYPNRDEEREKLMERFRGIVEEDGEIISVDEWGMRKLAYEINYTNEGYYVLVNFESTSTQVDEADRVMRITDCVMRKMIIRDDE
ncbi:MAG: 30S ribosomal protein S6 [Tissierellia bacterium]|nr:30S ribosomal protein S6 [Tissierellia bacterium]